MRHLIRNIYCMDKGVVLLAFVVLSLLCAVYKFLFQSKKFNNSLVGVAFAFCVAMALGPSILTRFADAYTRELALEPFRSIKLYFHTGYEEWLRVLVMNMAMFYPLGCAFACFNKQVNIKPWMFFCFSFLLSVAIETVQYIFSLGVSETDDVIFNTLGAVLGYLITFLFYKMFEKSAKGNTKLEN
ncbi:VanZ family protein [Eubacterium coprostanoligenes]|uniref:VanZ like family protein n=2 Tax=Eubacterium coprostanoligenes TaxID=290054 RepID=A0A1T4LA81_9FIRM|nr:VanZ family protein [Eubacterium coprostanoligenes]MDY4698751.1 VanZ family protein [Eubacterium coprostanoligenes]MDY5399442.1 VanZ family protein [Eubacterium coprostanoligenes]SJZ51503.1 VanZ like family protein [Eubacterium coprostanoligenes]